MDDLMTFLSIIMLVFGILEIILFFKIWGMTNDVSKIKQALVYNVKPPQYDKDRLAFYRANLWAIDFNDLNLDFIEDEEVEKFAKSIFYFYKKAANKEDGLNPQKIEDGINKRAENYSAKIQNKDVDLKGIAKKVILAIDKEIKVKD